MDLLLVEKSSDGGPEVDGPSAGAVCFIYGCDEPGLVLVAEGWMCGIHAAHLL